MENKTLFVIASGSGGHILPALVLAKKWKLKKQGKVIFFTGNKKLDQKILDDSNFIDKKIHLKLNNFPGKKILLYPVFFTQLIMCFIKSIYYSYKYKPNKIITTGGYLAIPVCFASKLFNSFIELYELNVVPGKAIVFLSFIANKISIVFNDSKKHFKKHSQKLFLTNYPLRYSDQDKIFNKKDLIEKINKKQCIPQKTILFSENKKTIFLLGGSQGSVFLNNYFKNWLIENKDIIKEIQIIHQTGHNDKTNLASFYKNLNIPAIIFSYQQNLKNYYLLADEVVTRAGAGTLFELEFFKKKSKIFPLITATTSHQVDNAKIMEKRNKDLFEIKQS